MYASTRLTSEEPIPASAGNWQTDRVRLTERLSLPQRIVIVVGLGVACAAVGAYLASLRSAVAFGWYAHAPLTSPGPVRGGLPGWALLLIWLALTAAAWVLASAWILRPARRA